MDIYRRAYVYVNHKYAGSLRETDSGYSFAYDEKYLECEDRKPVSLTLPLSNEVYMSKILFPFFDGLIPEGWLLDVVVKNWKIDKNDRFGLMLVACKDCIGNVSVLEKKL